MSSVLYRSTGHTYPEAVQASGMYITDRSGKSYLDMSGGAAVSCLGHAHPSVSKTICQQINNMPFAHTAFFTSDTQEKLASILASHFGETDAKVYFTSGGSEANETALKLAWQYWKLHGFPNKTKIISRNNSYHGNTLGTLSVSGNPDRRRIMDHVLLDWPRIEPCYSFRFQKTRETDNEYAMRAANALETCILHEGSETIAAFIVETVVGASLGAVVAGSTYFKRIREICNKYDVLLICDEIMCGSGRTGSYFSFKQDGITPDITTLAKGIASGYQPLAATIANNKVAKAFEINNTNFAHGHTYVGHATACAAGLAVANTLRNEGLLDNVSQKGFSLLQVLQDTFKEHPFVGDIRGRGLFLAIEFVSDRSTKRPLENAVKIAKKLKQSAMDNGLICYPNGGSPESGLSAHILLAPPFILQNTHMEEASNKLKQVAFEVFNV